MVISRNKLLDYLFTFSFFLLGINSYTLLLEDEYPTIKFLKYFTSFFVLFTFLLYRHYFKPKTSGFISYITILFSAYSVLLILRSIQVTPEFLKYSFGNPFHLMAYLIPLILINTKINLFSLSLLIKFTKKFLPITIVLILYVFFLLNSEKWLRHFSLITIFEGSITLLYITRFINPSKRINNYLVFVIIWSILIISALYGRRGIFLDYSLIIAFSYLLLYSTKSVALSTKKIIVLLGFVFFTVLMFYFLNELAKFYVFERGFSQDAWNESRGKVIDDFFLDFRSYYDWIFGRNINGTVLGRINAFTFERSSIENGFLHTILKGGLFYLIPQLIIFVYAFYIGWFRSYNVYTKAMAALIIIHILGMIAFNIPSFGVRYLLVWIYVSLIINTNICRLSNVSIQRILFFYQ